MAYLLTCKIQIPNGVILQPIIYLIYIISFLPSTFLANYTVMTKKSIIHNISHHKNKEHMQKIIVLFSHSAVEKLAVGKQYNVSWWGYGESQVGKVGCCPTLLDNGIRFFMRWVMLLWIFWRTYPLNMVDWLEIQGWFQVCTQPMRDGVTL